MRRIALFSVLSLPFVFAALPAASLFGELRPAGDGRTLVVVNALPAASNTQLSDSASPGAASDPVAYGVSHKAAGDCHAPSTETAGIEG